MEIFRDIGFVHLHVHSSYSLREGALTIGKLAKMATADAQPALAITDTNNLFGALEFSEKLAKEGVQPIVGVQLAVDFGDSDASLSNERLRQPEPGGLVLLARNDESYRSRLRLVTPSCIDTEAEGYAHVTLPALAASSQGLIALTGGVAGPVDSLFRAGRPEAARARIEKLARVFGAPCSQMAMSMDLRRPSMASLKSGTMSSTERPYS